MEMLRRQKEVLEAEAISSAAKVEQRRKAGELYERVCEWRKEKEEAVRREERERERERRKEEEEREREERKIAEHRAKLKAKVRNVLQKSRMYACTVTWHVVECVLVKCPD